MPITLQSPSGVFKPVVGRSGARYTPASSTGVVTVPDNALGDVADLVGAGFTQGYVNTSVARLKQAVMSTPVGGPAVGTYSALNVTRGAQNGSTVSAGSPLVSGTYADMRAALKANALWTRFSGAIDVSNTNWNGVWSQPALNNPAGWTYGVPPVHFQHDGQYFEVLLTSANPSFTVLADGNYIYPKSIVKNVINGADGVVDFFDGLQNCWVKFDLGSRALRKISLHGFSGGAIGNFALAGVNDSVTGWDRSNEPWAMMLTDSYGATSTTKFYNGGPYRDALARIGIADALINSFGGTGYAPTATQTAESNCGRARSADMAQFQNPDIFLCALGINDNVNYVGDGLYPTAAAAQAGFTSAVNTTLNNIRSNSPNSVLVVLSPWFTTSNNANFSNPTIGAGWKLKRDIILAKLQSLSGPWIWVDPFLDHVLTSSGYTFGPRGTYNASAAAGPNPSGANWWTGQGKTTATTGDGNGDLYTTDGTHPNVIGCDYLASRLAGALRQAILAL